MDQYGHLAIGYAAPRWSRFETAPGDGRKILAVNIGDSRTAFQAHVRQRTVFLDLIFDNRFALVFFAWSELEWTSRRRSAYSSGFCASRGQLLWRVLAARRETEEQREE